MNEPLIELVRGTRDWLPRDYEQLAALERHLLSAFNSAGYESVRTPVLEFAEMHERKSGAGIVARLLDLADDRSGRVCLRPELTASIVRAYVAAAEAPVLPWRVCSSGPVFRDERLRPGVAREFMQVGVELLGAPGVEADAEVIALADATLRSEPWYISQGIVRVGHLGLVLELLAGSGLSPAAQAALVEVLSEAASGGEGVSALEGALDRLSNWLASGDDATGDIVSSVSGAEDRGVDRLFRQLVPDVTGRREGHEIVGRVRRKWDLGHSLPEVVARLREPLAAIATLRGPASEVMLGLRRDFGKLAPATVARLEELMRYLQVFGVPTDSVELDMGFSRGIGFYSHMVFAIEVPTADGPLEVCGGGRYDGLARALGSDRDAHGVGFAFGLERLASVTAPAVRAAFDQLGRGYVVVPAEPRWCEEAVRFVCDHRKRGTAELALDASFDHACSLARDRGRMVVVVSGPYQAAGSLRCCPGDRPDALAPVPFRVLSPELLHEGEP